MCRAVDVVELRASAWNKVLTMHIIARVMAPMISDPSSDCELRCSLRTKIYMLPLRS